MIVSYDSQIWSMQKYGGISRYYYELIRRLAEHEDVRVDLHAGLHISGYDLRALKHHCRRFHARRRPYIPYTGFLARPMNRLLAKLHGDPKSDLVHHTYYRLHPDISRTAKRVVTVYDMIQELFPDLFAAGDPTAADKAQAVHEADGILAISEQTKRDLMRIYDVAPEKIRVVHLANSLTYEVSQEDLPRELQAGDPYLLYVGPRYVYKNYQALAEAYAAEPLLHRSARLVLCGGGPLKSQERAVYEKAGIAERVLQIPGDDRRLAALYAHAAVFVYPSLYEGFGIPPLEAMSYDCPVVASTGGSIPEICGDAALYFAPEDRDALVRNIATVLNDHEQRQALIQRGRAREQKYSWRRCADETLQYYKEIIA